MCMITMEEIYGLDSFAELEEAPRLSFCDLPMAGLTSPSPTTQSAQPDHLFEFFAPPAAAADVILFGKLIINEEAEYDHKVDYFAAAKSQSLRNPDHAAAEKRRLSASTRVFGDLFRPKGDVNYQMQRVNFSSLTSMSAKSRRRMFMFGPVKFRPEMELSAIRQRQATRAPAPVKPPPPPRKSRWGLVKSSLRGRSPLTTALARCIPAACGGVERWAAVAN